MSSSSTTTTTTSTPPVPPRIAVIGGGIAGTLASLVLKNRGLHPVILDAGTKSVGGRLSNGGAQFLRVSDPRLLPVAGMLQHAGLLRPFLLLDNTVTTNNNNNTQQQQKQQQQQRYGMLGSSGGGFLPAEIVASLLATGGSGATPGGIMGLSPAEPATNNDTTSTTASTNTMTDGGDFCGFVQGSASKGTTTFVGVPNTAALCSQICQLANIDHSINRRVTGATMVLPTGGWKVDYDVLGADEDDSSSSSSIDDGDDDKTFDAMILATHDPSLPSQIVKSIVQEEMRARNEIDVDKNDKNENDNDNNNLLLLSRLNELSDKLQAVRDNGKRPLYTITVEYPSKSEEDGFGCLDVPFDAVSVPGSQVIQFLVRESSKQEEEEETSNNNNNDNVWTAISTSRFADEVLSKEDATTMLTTELAHLLSPYYTTTSNNNDKEESSSSSFPEPTKIRFIKRWGAALSEPGLGLKEDSITLAQWRLAICGDYIKDFTTDSGGNNPGGNPWEAAALSGLEAGERVAALFASSSSSSGEEEE